MGGSHLLLPKLENREKRFIFFEQKEKVGDKEGSIFQHVPNPRRKRRVRSEMSVTPKKEKKNILNFFLCPLFVRKKTACVAVVFNLAMSPQREKEYITFLLLLGHTCESVCLMWRICLWARKIANNEATKKSTNKSGFPYDKWDKCLLGKGGPIFTSSPSEK